MAYNGFKGIGPRELGASPLKQIRRAAHVRRNKYRPNTKRDPFHPFAKKQSPAKQPKDIAPSEKK